jgi:hypothetical protein
MRTALRRTAAAAATALAASALTGCSLFGEDTTGAETSVFDVKPHQCFTAMDEVEAELSSLNQVECSEPHALEAYAKVSYQPAEGQASGGGYPGNESLRSFAQGACAQQFADYVGLDYRDSDLFFTFLLPSARGWEQASDRSVFCFITSPGAPLTQTAKGAKT